jgi:TPR repeat protein
MRFLLAVILIISLTACVDSQTHEFNDALEKFSQQDYPAAVKILSVLAENGYAPAQFRLGVMYISALGVKNNPRQAAYWFEKAAQQDDLPSQYSLARLYMTGIGVPKSEAQALRWFEQTAERGYAPSQFQTGIMYEQGLGTAKHDGKAEQWIRRAAENKYRPAQLMLAKAYQQGALGLPQDKDLAEYWSNQTRHSFF